MAEFQIKPSAFVYIAKKALHRTETDRSFDKEYRRFRAHFGASPRTCAILWKKLVDHGILPQGRKPVHLLWALYFLNRYEIEEVAAATFGVDEETFRNWSWKLVVAIAKLKPSIVSMRFIFGEFTRSSCISTPFCRLFNVFPLLFDQPYGTDQVVKSASQRRWSMVQDLSGWNRLSTAAATSRKRVLLF